jgi:hypothetical protein
MPHPDIISYYMLCSVNDRRAPHILNILEKNEYNKLISTTDSDKLIKNIDGKMNAREFVVGAQENVAIVTIIN